MTKIVTSASLVQMMKDRGAVVVIGRACLSIYNRQTLEEQDSLVTRMRNGVGFTAFDAKVGSLTAIYYRDHKTLLPWHIEYWSKIMPNGYPKICRYAKQLNEVAKVKEETKRKQQSK